MRLPALVVLVLLAGCKKPEPPRPPASAISALRAIAEEVGVWTADVVQLARLYDEGTPEGQAWGKHLAGDWAARCRVLRRTSALLVEAARHPELDPFRARFDDAVMNVFRATETVCDGAPPGPLKVAVVEPGERRVKGAIEGLDARLRELLPAGPPDGGAQK